MPKAIMGVIRWGFDVNFKAFLTKESMKRVTQLSLSKQTIFFVWIPLDFSNLC